MFNKHRKQVFIKTRIPVQITFMQGLITFNYVGPVQPRTTIQNPCLETVPVGIRNLPHSYQSHHGERQKVITQWHLTSGKNSQKCQG